MANPFDQFDPGYKAPDRGLVRGAADLGLEVASGVTRGVGMLSNVFGANNPVSQATRTADDFIRDYLSAQSKEDSARAAAIMAEAEDQGIGAQVVAGLRAFAQNPLSTIANTAGIAVPTIAGGVAALGGRAAVAGGARAIGSMAGIGAASGVGEAKGGIFDAVKAEQLKQPGMTEADATAAAEAAQSYNGPNAGNLALAGGIGALSGATGLQPAAARILTGGKGMLSPATKQIEQGLLRRIGQGALVEGGTEFAQEGQQAYAQNIALQNEGFDVPSFRGVVSQGTMGAVAGGMIGSGLGAFDKQSPAPDSKPTIKDIADAPTVDAAIQRAQLLLAAPAQKTDWEVVDGVQLLSGPKQETSPGMLGLPAPGAPTIIADERGNATVQPAAQRAEAISRQTEAEFKAEQARRAQADLNASLGMTPGTRAAQQQRMVRDAEGNMIPVGEATELPYIPTGDATEVAPIPTGEASDYIPTGDATELAKKIPVGKATDASVETIIADDLLTGDGMPYGTRSGASMRARKEGLGLETVTQVPGGWVVRPQPTTPGEAGQEVRPAGTRGTSAQDVVQPTVAAQSPDAQRLLTPAPRTLKERRAAEKEQSDGSVARAIRKAVEDVPSRIVGSWHPVTVSANGRTQVFMSNIKRVVSDGKGPQAISLQQIRPGRLMAGDPLRPLVYSYKLNRANELVEEGIPREPSESEASRWKNAFEKNAPINPPQTPPREAPTQRAGAAEAAAPAAVPGAADTAGQDAGLTVTPEIRAKWPGLKGESDEHIAATEAWDKAQNRVRAAYGYRSTVEADIQDAYVEEVGQPWIAKNRTAYVRELTRRLNAEADRVQALENTPGTLESKRADRKAAKERESSQAAVDKATADDIAFNLARVRELQRQGRLTQADAERLLELARGSKDSFDAAMRLEDFVSDKEVAPSQAMPVGRADTPANDAAPAPTTIRERREKKAAPAPEQAPAPEPERNEKLVALRKQLSVLKSIRKCLG